MHFGSVGWRMLKAVWAWEPLAPIIGRLLGAYGLLAVTVAVGFLMHNLGVGPLTQFVLVLPGGPALYLLAVAMTPAVRDDRGKEGVSSSL